MIFDRALSLPKRSLIKFKILNNNASKDLSFAKSPGINQNSQKMQHSKYAQVNWSDGMKLNKDVFIAQDNAQTSSSYSLISSSLSPIRYGLLPGNNNFNTQIAVDNQNTVRVTVISCKAITSGGVLINIDATEQNNNTDGNPSATLPVSVNSNNIYWAILLVKPYERNPFGEIDPAENPARFPYVKPGYEIILADNSQINQYAQHPFALIVGKVLVNGSSAIVDQEYLPPCISVSASQDLMGLHSELDSFLAGLEQSCSQIVQKIYKKSQQNDLSELAQFLCDRIMLFLGQSITEYRWSYIHETPAKMISTIAGLARVIKNTIDLRIGSGKDELMTYLCEWCELNQGELEGLLSSMAALRYNHNDVNQNIGSIIEFAKIIGKLFNTLANLEFIGKKKESGLFVKEEQQNFSQSTADAAKPKRRFFG